ncbi:hypothetical protein K474DRAFT_820476 [Panus rudis PR-1116 ss-1]|nr:hypothetical protein K474DRAFT_820476 [Panus rudis PR-1116 ss-1]
MDCGIRDRVCWEDVLPTLDRGDERRVRDASYGTVRRMSKHGMKQLLYLRISETRRVAEKEDVWQTDVEILAARAGDFSFTLKSGILILRSRLMEPLVTIAPPHHHPMSGIYRSMYHKQVGGNRPRTE